MARGRMLDKRLATWGKFNKLTRDEQWLYMSIMKFADDQGRLPGDLVELRMICIPGSTINNADIEEYLVKMDDLELIYYDKGSVIEFRRWRDFQTFKYKPAKSFYPTPSAYAKSKERHPEEIEVPEDVSEANFSNILLTFEDFWDLGFRKINRKKCIERWDAIPIEERQAVIAYGKRYVKGKKGLAYPLVYLNSDVWKNKSHSKNIKDYTNISDTVFRGYCSACSKEIFFGEENMNDVTQCCDAEISPYQIVKKLIKRSSE